MSAVTESDFAILVHWKLKSICHQWREELRQKNLQGPLLTLFDGNFLVVQLIADVKNYTGGIFLTLKKSLAKHLFY